MNSKNTANIAPGARLFKNRFVLTRKNQKGQVAIFVALIFQVIFVFFALLINVGLLVHHKINLQHSTDLAAYYGAMKQAEQMNAISHINFQMRQNWKLLTWRYRILGTFGAIPRNTLAGNDVNFQFPFTYDPKGNANAGSISYYGSWGRQASKASPYINGFPGNAPTLNCENYPDPTYTVDGAKVGLQDIPFFCVAHPGFKSWPDQNDSQCQLSCAEFSSAFVVNNIRPLATTYITPMGGNMATSTNQTIAAVNQNLNLKCEKLGPLGASMITKFLDAYLNETTLRSETIKMLAANLSQDADKFLDIEGELIKAGSERTFKNNLTGANFTGLQADSFKVYNGLSDGKCKFTNGNPDEGTQFLKRIEFKLINYFIQNCTTGAGGTNYLPVSVYSDNNPNGSGLATAFDTLTDAEKGVLSSLTQPQSLHTIGYEKNPNCIEYYAVKSYSEPNIPFLPLSNIKLEATAVAKPFGGSIGPWYGTKWGLGSPKSEYNDSDPNSKMDATLPMRDDYSSSSSNALVKSVYAQPNFSLFVGDRLGLRNLDYIAAYHSMLVTRDILSYPNTNSAAAKKAAGDNKLGNTQVWPDYTNWDGLTDTSVNFKLYDILATDRPDEAGMRAIEMTVIAPNQFDLFHYSIDPDFYNNYYVKLYKGFDKIKSAAGNNVSINKDQLRADFGAKDMDGNSVATAPMSPKTFSVKDQIMLKNIVLDVAPSRYGPNIFGSPTPPAGSNGTKYSDFLNYLVSLQSSLLTGWTFLKYNDYNTFAGDPITRPEKVMSFGQCDDSWNKTSRAIGNKTDPQDFETPMKAKSDNPPATGNCVTGGRTGYSVKIISPYEVSGGDATSKMLNTLDPSFLQF